MTNNKNLTTAIPVIVGHYYSAKNTRCVGQGPKFGGYKNDRKVIDISGDNITFITPYSKDDFFDVVELEEWNKWVRADLTESKSINEWRKCE